MSEHRSTASKKPVVKRTAQQWAWQFLRRNPKYIEAYALISSFTKSQYEQLHWLTEYSKGFKCPDGFFDEAVIGTLDFRLFETNYFECSVELGETVEEYRARTSKIDGLDELIELKVRRDYWLDTYCLNGWVDPVATIEVDEDFAARMWGHEPILVCGLESASWLPSIVGVNMDGFRSWQSKGRRFNANAEHVQTKGPMLKGADGQVFLRSPTIWHPEHQVPTLGASEVDVRFDLNLPLEFQIKRVQAELKEHKRNLLKAKIVDRHSSQADRNGLYQEYLSILDRLTEGATLTSLTLEFDSAVEKRMWKRRPAKNDLVQVSRLANPDNPNDDREKITANMRQKLVRATRLRDRDYKALAFL